MARPGTRRDSGFVRPRGDGVVALVKQTQSAAFREIKPSSLRCGCGACTSLAVLTWHDCRHVRCGDPNDHVTGYCWKTNRVVSWRHVTLPCARGDSSEDSADGRHPSGPCRYNLRPSTNSKMRPLLLVKLIDCRWTKRHTTCTWAMLTSHSHEIDAWVKN
jgi:hypothetical protein